MNKDNLKKIRNKMINKFWEDNKAEFSAEECGYVFGLNIAQFYRIIKKVAENKNNLK